MERSSSSLGHRTGRAVGHRLLGNIAGAFITIGSGIFLARTLSPSDFGVFAIGLSLYRICDLVSSAGMLPTLVQRSEVRPAHETAAVAMQLVAAALLIGVGVLGAEPLEHWFGMAGLAPVLLVLAVGFPVRAIGLVPVAMLTRSMSFGRLAIVDCTMRLARALAAITLVLGGYGAVALAAGVLAGVAARTLLAIILAGRLPRLARFDRNDVSELARYGGGIVSISATNELTRRIDLLTVGHAFGSELLGLYQRGFQYALMPFEYLAFAANRVFFSAMSAVKDDSTRFRRAYLMMVRFLALAVYPLVTLLVMAAHVAIPFVYGPQWASAVPFVYVLAAAVYIRIAYNACGVAVQTRGRVGAEAGRQVLFLIAMIICASIGRLFGPMAVAVGVVVAGALFLALMLPVALDTAGVSMREWVDSLRTGTLSSAAMAVAMAVCNAVFGGSLGPAMLLATLVVCGGLSYLAAVRLLATAGDRELFGPLRERIPDRFQPVLDLFVPARAGGLVNP